MTTIKDNDDVVIIRRPGKTPEDSAEIVYEKETPRGKVTYGYKRPFILELELTWKCNLKCYHCYVDATEEPSCEELTFTEVKTVIDDAVSIGMSELSLTGGEVLLCDHFFETLTYGHSKGMGLRFVTNGTLITDEVIDKLKTLPVKLVTVSLDAYNEKAHNTIRGCNCFHETLQGIRTLTNAGFKVSIISAFSKDNFPWFEDTLEFCRSIRADWQIQMTSCKGRCSMEKLLSTDEYYLLGEKVATAITQEKAINIIPMDDLATFSRFYPLSILSSTWQGGCSGGKLNMFVRADGSVTPCSAISFEPFLAGNIRKESFKSICLNEKCRPCLSEWLDTKYLTGSCARCPHKERCRGGCPEILCTMCDGNHENTYCYWKIEEDRIRKELEGIW